MGYDQRKQSVENQYNININIVREEVRERLKLGGFELGIDEFHKIGSIPIDMEILRFLNEIDVKYDDLLSDYSQVKRCLDTNLMRFSGEIGASVADHEIASSIDFLIETGMIEKTVNPIQKGYRITSMGKECLMNNRS